jgi:arginase family enzyme
VSDPYKKKSAVTGEAYDPKMAPRYTEIPTFMRTPHVSRVTDLDIAIVGVPFDGGVTNRPGARHGPREIRNMSSLTRTIHHMTRVNPYELCRVGEGPTYISFDVDSLDPVYAPGTGTPEIGGLTTREAQALLRGLRGLNLIGGDVVEVAPPFDPTGNTALVGATIMYEILCLLAEALVFRKG